MASAQNDIVQESKESKSDDNDLNMLLSQANATIESGRNTLVFFNFIPRESMKAFISSSSFEDVKDILIDRSKWMNHKNFEHQSLLVKAHRRFRQSSQKLVKYSLNANLAIRAFKNSYENDTKIDFNFDKININDSNSKSNNNNDNTNNNNNNKKNSNSSDISENMNTNETKVNIEQSQASSDIDKSILNLITSDESFADRIHELIREMQRCYDSVHWSLRSHSNYEETKLFQFLKIKYNCPHFIELLLQDHSKIEQLESDIEMILRKYDGFSQRMARHYANEMQNAKNIERMATLSVDVLKLMLEFDDTLVRHLGEEETVVVPMLLHLSKKEYDTYYNARSYKEALGYTGLTKMTNDNIVKTENENEHKNEQQGANNVSKLKIDNVLPK